jgi:hypothetical protein
MRYVTKEFILRQFPVGIFRFIDVNKHSTKLSYLITYYHGDKKWAKLSGNPAETLFLPTIWLKSITCKTMGMTLVSVGSFNN